jgi:hypothetical protein
MMKSESDRPITIEDLLRLKRAERPPAEFWTAFDRELRAKQLSALVGKRPWWQKMPSTFPRLFRYRILLGASAVFALTVVSLRHDRSVPSQQPDQVVEKENVAVIEMTSNRVAVSLPSPSETATVEQPALTISTPAPVIAVTTPAPTEVTDVVRGSIPLGATIKIERVADLPSPPARDIIANLAVIRSTEPAVSRSLLAQSNGFEVRAASTRTTVEPLQQMTPPSETRRSRILTAMVATAPFDSSVRTTERAASRIDEERLYDQIHRFGARADRVQYKF